MRQVTLDCIESMKSMLLNLGDMINQDTQAVNATRDHVQIIRHYDQLRQCAAKIKEAREAISDMEDTMSRITVPEAMRDHGVKTTTVIGVGRVTISHRFSCSMLDKERGFIWLRETGNDGLITETVNSSSLAAFAKDMLQNQGKELPADIFKTSVNAFTSITKVQA